MRDTMQVKVWLSSPSDALKLDDPDHVPLYNVSESDMSEYGWIHVGEFTATMERPSARSVLPAAIAGLRARQNKINLQAAEANAKLDEQIQNLLALTHEVA